MDDEQKCDRNVYGSNLPASEGHQEPDIRDDHSPEQVDAEEKARRELKARSAQEE